MSTRQRLAALLTLGVCVAGLSGCSDPGETADAKAPELISLTPEPSNTLTPNLDAKGFAAAVAQPNVTLIDVRTPAEYDAGHIKGAINIDFNSPDFATKVSDLDHGARYLLYCRSGNRSAQAMALMTSHAFTKVQHLAGGFQAWTAAGNPVEK